MELAKAKTLSPFFVIFCFLAYFFLCNRTETENSFIKKILRKNCVRMIFLTLSATLKQLINMYFEKRLFNFILDHKVQ